ncbi:MAG: hypothetical protein ACOYXN_12790 [Acidobacteriota bacterium]
MRRVWMNFADVPFFNRTIPAALALLVAGAAVILTLFNLATFFVVGREFRSERKILLHQRQRMETLQREMGERKAALEGRDTGAFAGEVAFLARLIEAKRFDWPRFLSDLERVKPYGVMLTAVTPKVKESGVVQVQLRGVANPRGELLKLEENLFSDPRFRAGKLEGEQKEPGSPWVTFSMTCEYLPEAPREP